MKQSWPNWGTALEFAWQDWEKPLKTSVRIASVVAMIQTDQLNLGLYRYHYDNLFGSTFLSCKFINAAVE
jgi:hypothetical protein